MKKDDRSRPGSREASPARTGGAREDILANSPAVKALLSRRRRELTEASDVQLTPAASGDAEQCAELFDFEKIKPPFHIGGKPYELAVELTDDTPIVQRAWRMSPEKERIVDEHINKLLKAGVIYPIADSPYSAVNVLVDVPNTKKLGL